jgi:hypothetical protein
MKMKTRFALLFGGLMILAVGVTIAGPTDPFPHDLHLEEVDDCTMCHKAGADGEMDVDKAACAECHDDETPGFRPVMSDGPEILRFPHALHVEAGDCTDCHKLPAMAFPRGKKTCDACHKENDVEVPESACASCHGKPAHKLTPADHKGTWAVSHGKAAPWRVFSRHGKDCTTCHKQDACDSCHRTSRPRSHTGLWRLRTHGTAASWNRDTCRTCHETGGCVACHQNTPPMNHIGAWSKLHGLTARSKADTSCNACHNVGYCNACHAGK